MILELGAEEVAKFQKKILGWYAENRRELPWRDVPYGTSFQEVVKKDFLDLRAYRVLVSEVMLQQTQVGRVVSEVYGLAGAVCECGGAC